MRKTTCSNEGEIGKSIRSFIKSKDIENTLGLMNTSEKVLYYLNNMDENNRFRGVIEFPSIYCVRLANILCKDKDMVQKYKDKYYSVDYRQYEVIDSLHKLKKDIINQRIKIDESRDMAMIEIAIENGDCELLRSSLQELFLEYLETEQVENIFIMIHNGINICDIMKWYRKGKKILAMTTFGVEYIKGI